MRSLYVAAFALLSATAAAGQEPAVSPAADAAVAATAAASATPAVRIPERSALQAPRLQREQREEPAADAATQAELQRGSFWWLVAVIVVAGVILAIVL